MRRPSGSVWWLIFPVCSTIVTGVRLAAMREHLDGSSATPCGQPFQQPAIPVSARGRASIPGRRPPARPEWIKRIGHLRLVKWGDPSGVDHETIIVRDGRGGTVARIAGHWVNLVQVQDLTGEGVPDLVIRTCDGGVHGGFAYYIYSAGPQPRCLLAYYKKNGDDDPDHWPDLALKDLDGDGRKELVSWYDGFAYGGEVFNWACSYGGSARVPIALGLRHGRFVDVARQCRPWLRRKLAEAREDFLDGLDEAKTEGLTGDRAQGMIEYYAVALLLHDRTTARRMVLHILPEKDRAFFLQHCGLLKKVLADRWQRYAYPPAYSTIQAFASEALPPPDTEDATPVSSKAAPAGRRSPHP